MWKQVGLVLALSVVGLAPGSAEARFGKRSSPPPSGGSGSPGRPSGPSHGGGSGGAYHPRPAPSYGHTYGYFSPYGYYGDPWSRYYYFDPAWAWPFLGPGVPSYGRYYAYSDPYGRRPRRVMGVQDQAVSSFKTDFFADGGAVSKGYSVGLGLQTDGERFGFGLKLNLFNLATDDGSLGRDSISLLSVAPSLLLVNHARVTWRVSGGLDAAFAPDVTMVGPGLGTSARLGLVGPLKLEANAHVTPLPYIQLSGDAGLAVDLGVVRLRGGYRATYLNDQGVVDGHVNRDLFQGPYAGLSLVL
jgi:hypothetical protein